MIEEQTIAVRACPDGYSSIFFPAEPLQESGFVHTQEFGDPRNFVLFQGNTALPETALTAFFTLERPHDTKILLRAIILYNATSSLIY
jgi:hypothetical protein